MRLSAAFRHDPTMPDVDVVIIGGGHNGLTCAAYLGMAGLSVRVVEKRGVVGGTGTDPVPVGQVAHPPVLVHRVQPKYPQQARRQQVHGLVLLEAVLDRDGRVEHDVKILESIPILDDEAVAAVRRWRFQPARNRNGDPLRVIVEIPIRFVLR